MQQVPYASRDSSSSSMDDIQFVHPSITPTSPPPPSSLPTILCCLCGTRIVSNPVNMCLNCLKSQVDITEGVSKQLTIFFCRNCQRYQRPPWVALELESREMLAFCLKKVKGLGKEVKLVDASFIWTEPHSRRIKVKLVIQKEVFSSAILQQAVVVEFIVATQQCTDCQKSFTEHTWTAVVQVRQKVAHKKTMLMLEQLMLKHNIVSRAMGVKEHGDGLDFYWATKSGANHLLDFLRSVVPIRSKLSKRLISQDLSSNTATYKYTQYAEVSPVCKDDLVMLDSKLAALLGVGGGGAGVWIVTRVTSNLTLLDPVTLKMAEVSGGTYWHYPFRALMTAKQLTEYMVVEKEELAPFRTGGASSSSPAGRKDDKKRGRDASVDGRSFSKATIPGMAKLSLARFSLMKVSEMGSVDTQYECVSHLGHLLHVGDRALGYDITNANIEEDDDMTANQRSRRSRTLPQDLEVVLVRKAYDKTQRAKKRKFVLKTLVKEDADVHARGGRRGDERRNDVDMEEFLQDIEEDTELQGKVNLYRRRDEGKRMAVDGEEEEEEGEEPEIDMDALLDEMGSMQVSVGGDGAAAAAMSENETDDERGEFETDWDVGGGAGGADAARKSGTSSASHAKRNRK